MSVNELPDQYKRFARQVMIRGFGVQGQEKLRKASVFVVGCGGLGCTVLQTLVRAGLGRLIICDSDTVELPDLHRQLLYREQDIGRDKVTVAAELLRSINSQIEIDAHKLRVDADNIAGLTGCAELVIDASDNIATRSIINAFSVKHNVDWIYGGCEELTGTCMVVRRPTGACLECVFGPLDHREMRVVTSPLPVMPTLPVVVAAIEATEALKYLVWPQRQAKASRLISVDLTDPRVQTISNPAKDPACPTCSPES